MIEVTTARMEDLEVLREMAIETYEDTFAEFNTPQNMRAYFKEAYSLKQMGIELTEPGSVVHMAWDGDQSMGFSRLRTNGEVRDHLGENTIELQRLYVRKQFHGRKVGARLMDEAIAFARAGKYAWIWLGVWERNFKAQEFYKKWGFVRFSEHIFKVGDDPQTDWLLKLKL